MLAAEVVRWSDASFVEDQDQWWHAGIHREVFLYSTPRTFLATCTRTASLTGELDDRHARPAVEVVVRGSRARRRLGRCARACETERGRRGDDAELRGAGAAESRRRIASAVTPCACDAEVADVAPWSAEIPSRYRLAGRISLDPDGNVHDTATLLDRVPARRDHGSRVPRERRGRAVPWRQPPRLRSRHRTRRHRRADARGSRADEAVRIQRGAHLALPQRPALLRPLRRARPVRRRRGEHRDARVHLQPLQRPAVRRTRGSTAARGWCSATRTIRASSCGRSATSPATAPRTTRSRRGSAATTRPGRCTTRARSSATGPAARHVTDVLCPMYPEIADIVRWAEREERPDLPLIMCEYSHAMGNSNGCLADYWDAIEAPRRLAGRLHLGVLGPRAASGLPRRHGPLRLRRRLGQRSGRPVERADVNFCIDGVVWPDRTPKPALSEHKYLACPVRLRASGGNLKRNVIRLRNAQSLRATSTGSAPATRSRSTATSCNAARSGSPTSRPANPRASRSPD